MNIELLQVSAFTKTAGLGNAAGICEFEIWPDDDTLSRLARAVSLPVTACIVRRADQFELRWFSRSGTPVRSMCGHGTLAAAFAVSLSDPGLAGFTFQTPGGPVPVRKRGDVFYLELPRWDAVPLVPWPDLTSALKLTPVELLDAGRDVIAVYGSEEEVRSLEPDMAQLLALGHRGFIATARGHQHDCVSRFFCPSFGLGVDEDPATGSAHCAIAPLWAQRLGKSVLRAYQASGAGGELMCEVRDHSVVIGASAALQARRLVSVP
ncbi:phenazine biosynthesis protein PhzF family [Variovorax sp. HW608]|uniref:PhzF family phenazine biosynthesis protein n=1 Tax=Variovorax sp. HW608 TaxID=1034889 RepID=UPI00081FC91B|nr:PhzF family phenazine biosynthesis protein [Variovorax sp. HW608]SCK20038.1 phenazine biosynthesis protein PhzF family [Variovorax sp. HW608]